MEGFEMNDWTLIDEETDQDGRSYMRLSYKQPDGEKHYCANYFSEDEIYVEVWHHHNGDYDVIQYGMTWSEAMAFDIPRE